MFVQTWNKAVMCKTFLESLKVLKEESEIKFKKILVLC